MAYAATHDVVIVGAGPAGATAAYLLASEGVDVLVLEKCSVPRPKLCGGLLTVKTVQMLEYLFGDVRAGLRDGGALLDVVRDYELCYRQTTLCRDRSQQPFWFVRRDLYDHFLVAAAQDAGARLSDGEKVDSVDLSDSTVHLSSGRTVRYGCLIGADGANSVTRRSLEFPSRSLARWRRNLAMAMECVVPHDRVGPYAGRPVIFFGYVNRGLCWAFPRGDRSVVGIGALPAAGSSVLVPAFRTFLGDLDIDYRDVDIKGHPVPFGYPLPVPGGAGCLLVGDSAGFVDPIYGEGVFFAHYSAALAARAVLDVLPGGTSPVPAYVASVRRTILPRLHRRRRWRDVLYGSVRAFGRWPVKASLLLFGKDFVLRHIHADFARYKDALA